MRVLLFLIFFVITNYINSQTLDQKILFTLQAKNEGRLSDFVIYEEDILSYIKTLNGEDTNYVNFLIKFSDANFYISNFNKSYAQHKKANEILSKFYSKNSDFFKYNLLTEKFKYIKLAESENNYNNIIKYEDEITKEWVNKFGEDTVYINLLNLFSEAHFNLNEYDKSIKFQLENIRVINKLYSKKSSIYRLKLIEISNLYAQLGLYDKQLEINIENLSITENQYGTSNVQYLEILNILSVNQIQLGLYKKAIKNYNNYFKIRDQLKLQPDSNYVQSLINLGVCYAEINDFTSSISLIEKGIKVNNIVNNEILQILALGNLGLINYKKGDYQNSLTYNFKALNLFDKYKISKSLNFRKSTIYNNIGVCYTNIGDYKSAIEYFNLCFANITNYEENYKQNYLNCLENLGSLYSTIGDFQKSLNIYFKCLEFYKENQTNSVNYLSTLSRIGLDYYHLNNFELALKYCNDVNSICLSNNLENSSLYYDNLNNLGLIYLETNKLDLSFQTFQKCLNFKKKTFNKKHKSYLITLNNIARYYSITNNFKKSIKIYQKILSCSKVEDIYYITLLNNIGFDYLNLNNYDKSILYFNQSRKINSTIFKDTVYESSRITLNGLIDNYKEIKQFSTADSLINESINLSILQLNKNKFGLTESEFLSFSNEIYFDLLFKTDYSISRSTKNPTILSKALNYYINYKLLLENGEIKDSAQIQIHSDYNKQKIKLYSYLENNDTISIDEEMQFNSNKIERKLTKSFKNNVDFEKMDWKSIQNSLKESESIIIINKIPLLVAEKKVIDSNRYLVYIVNKSADYPEIVILNEGVMFDKMINDFQSNNYSFDNLFSTKFWLPIEEKLNGNKNIYIMLDGEFNKVNLNTIYNTITKQYIIDEYRISYVMNLSDFINKNRLDQNQNQYSTSILIGSPNFNNSLKENKINLDSIYSYNPLSLRNFNMDIIDSNARGNKIRSLPNTKIEIQNIEKILISNKIKNTSFIEEDATEGNLKSINSPSILHIATHGYFVEDEKLKSSNSLLGFNKSKLVENPLLRSGLMLTGAGNFLNGNSKNQNENGLFTALEASTLDLTNTELVVLSACETGRGKLINGQGIQGLQKGFKDAGAKKIIMSLWKVDDKVTQEFMTTFYTLLFSEKDIHTAFTKTQLQIKEKYKLPYYWGAFILSEY